MTEREKWTVIIASIAVAVVIAFFLLTGGIGKSAAPKAEASPPTTGTKADTPIQRVELVVPVPVRDTQKDQEELRRLDKLEEKYRKY